jgi:hypothetical protein
VHVRYSLAPIAMSALLATPAFAASLAVNIEIPRLNASEYHRPYVATWIERADNTVAGTLAVWYDVRTKTNNPKAKARSGSRTCASGGAAAGANSRCLSTA